MPTTMTTTGKTLFFPDATRPSTPRDLAAIADQVHPNALLVFATRLVRSVRRRRHQPRAEATNRHRLELARLCLERADKPEIMSKQEAIDTALHDLFTCEPA